MATGVSEIRGDHGVVANQYEPIITKGWGHFWCFFFFSRKFFCNDFAARVNFNAVYLSRLLFFFSQFNDSRSGKCSSASVNAAFAHSYSCVQEMAVEGMHVEFLCSPLKVNTPPCSNGAVLKYKAVILTRFVLNWLLKKLSFYFLPFKEELRKVSYRLDKIYQYFEYKKKTN